MALDDVRLGQFSLCYHHPGSSAADLLQPGCRVTAAERNKGPRLLERWPEHLTIDRRGHFPHTGYGLRHHAREETLSGDIRWHRGPGHRPARPGRDRRLDAGFDSGDRRTDWIQWRQCF